MNLEIMPARQLVHIQPQVQAAIRLASNRFNRMYRRQSRLPLQLINPYLQPPLSHRQTETFFGRIHHSTHVLHQVFNCIICEHNFNEYESSNLISSKKVAFCFFCLKTHCEFSILGGKSHTGSLSS